MGSLKLDLMMCSRYLRIPQKPDQCGLRDGPLENLSEGGGGGGGGAGEVQKKIFAQGRIK